MPVEGEADGGGGWGRSGGVTGASGAVPPASKGRPREETLAEDPLNQKSAFKESLIATLLSATSSKKRNGKQAGVSSRKALDRGLKGDSASDRSAREVRTHK